MKDGRASLIEPAPSKSTSSENLKVHFEYSDYGGTTTLTFIVDGTNAVSSFVMRSRVTWNMAVQMTTRHWRPNSVKYHTSNDVFSRCKSVHKMATVKSDDELIQLDNNMRIWTRSGKFRKVENPELSMAW